MVTITAQELIKTTQKHGSKYASERASAVKALGKLPQQTAEINSALIACLEDEDYVVAKLALRNLENKMRIERVRNAVSDVATGWNPTDLIVQNVARKIVRLNDYAAMIAACE